MKSLLIAIKNLSIDITSFKLNRLLFRLANYSSAFFKTTGSISYPSEIQIEPSAVCNLKCKMCNLDSNIKHQPFFTPSMLTNLLNQLKNLSSINFTGMGETLLNPYLPELFRIASGRNIDISFITNGQLLTPQLIKDIFQFPIKSLVISMESGIPKYYESNRPGAKFDILNKNLTYLSKTIFQNNYKTKLSINIVLLPFNTDNLNHIYKIFDFGIKHGIKNFTFQNSNRLSSQYLESLYHSPNPKINKIFSKISNYAKSKEVTISFPSTKIHENSCYYPWIYPQITASGHLLPCCLIPQFEKYNNVISKYSWGNLQKHSFSSLWNNKSTKTFRRQLKKGTQNPCLNCSKFKGIL